VGGPLALLNAWNISMLAKGLPKIAPSSMSIQTRGNRSLVAMGIECSSRHRDRRPRGGQHSEIRSGWLVCKHAVVSVGRDMA